MANCTPPSLEKALIPLHNDPCKYNQSLTKQASIKIKLQETHGKRLPLYANLHNSPTSRTSKAPI